MTALDDLQAALNAAKTEFLDLTNESTLLKANLDAAQLQNAGLLQQIKDLQAQVAAQQPKAPGLGVYLDTDYGWPRNDVSNTYIQPNQRINLDAESARCARGTKPNLTMAAKGTNHIAGIAGGVAADIAWLQQYADDAATLADRNPKTDIYVSLVSEAKVAVALGALTGANAVPTNIGKAQGVFFRMIRDKARKNLHSNYWFAGYDRTFEGAVADAHGYKPDIWSWDPYANGSATQTFKGICQDDIAWVQSHPAYSGQPMALNEFGMAVQFGDDAMAKFYTNLRPQIAELGFLHAVLFNRMKDKDHQITNRTDGKKFPKAVAAFTSSLEG